MRMGEPILPYSYFVILEMLEIGASVVTDRKIRTNEF